MKQRTPRQRNKFEFQERVRREIHDLRVEAEVSFGEEREDLLWDAEQIERHLLEDEGP